MADAVDELLILEGPPAYSSFRLDKLTSALGVGGLYAHYVHLLKLDCAAEWRGTRAGAGTAPLRATARAGGALW